MRCFQADVFHHTLGPRTAGGGCTCKNEAIGRFLYLKSSSVGFYGLPLCATRDPLRSRKDALVIFVATAHSSIIAAQLRSFLTFLDLDLEIGTSGLKTAVTWRPSIWIILNSFVHLLYTSQISSNLEPQVEMELYPSFIPRSIVRSSGNDVKCDAATGCLLAYTASDSMGAATSHRLDAHAGNITAIATRLRGRFCVDCYQLLKFSILFTLSQFAQLQTAYWRYWKICKTFLVRLRSSRFGSCAPWGAGALRSAWTHHLPISTSSMVSPMGRWPGRKRERQYWQLIFAVVLPDLIYLDFMFYSGPNTWNLLTWCFHRSLQNCSQRLESLEALRTNCRYHCDCLATVWVACQCAF